MHLSWPRQFRDQRSSTRTHLRCTLASRTWMAPAKEVSKAHATSLHLTSNNKELLELILAQIRNAASRDYWIHIWSMILNSECQYSTNKITRMCKLSWITHNPSDFISRKSGFLTQHLNRTLTPERLYHLITDWPKNANFYLYKSLGLWSYPRLLHIPSDFNGR